MLRFQKDSVCEQRVKKQHIQLRIWIILSLVQSPASSGWIAAPLSARCS